MFFAFGAADADGAGADRRLARRQAERAGIELPARRFAVLERVGHRGALRRAVDLQEQRPPARRARPGMLSLNVIHPDKHHACHKKTHMQILVTCDVH